MILKTNRLPAPEDVVVTETLKPLHDSGYPTTFLDTIKPGAHRTAPLSGDRTNTTTRFATMDRIEPPDVTLAIKFAKANNFEIVDLTPAGIEQAKTWHAAQPKPVAA